MTEFGDRTIFAISCFIKVHISVLHFLITRKPLFSSIEAELSVTKFLVPAIEGFSPSNLPLRKPEKIGYVTFYNA